jgi:RNA 2',3'-cyclic 3'-phosphodiesterase
MARIRTFIAVDPGKVIRDRLVSLQKKLADVGGDVKWVEPANLHFTLLFLGEVDERDVLDVCKAVRGVTEELPAFTMTVAGTGCFPNMRRPRVVWVGLKHGAKEMVALHDALEKPLLQLGCYRREAREYTPHITLGRIKTDQPMTDLAAALTKHQSWNGGEAVIGEVHVMSSELKASGPIYAVLSRAKFSGEPRE